AARELCRGHALGGRLQRRDAVHDLPAAGVVDQQRDDVVALGVERRDHGARRRQRDGVLGGTAAGDDGDAHAPGHGVVEVVTVDWSSWPTKSVTTNGLVFGPSMSWLMTRPS